MKSRSGVDSFDTASRPMCWLVNNRPFGETNEPDPPPSRVEDSRTWSYHAWGASNPYFSFRILRGGLSKVHMPSSARPISTAATVTRATLKRILRIME